MTRVPHRLRMLAISLVERKECRVGSWAQRYVRTLRHGASAGLPVRAACRASLPIEPDRGPPTQAEEDRNRPSGKPTSGRYASAHFKPPRDASSKTARPAAKQYPTGGKAGGLSNLLKEKALPLNGAAMECVPAARNPLTWRRLLLY